MTNGDTELVRVVLLRLNRGPVSVPAAEMIQAVECGPEVFFGFKQAHWVIGLT